MVKARESGYNIYDYTSQYVELRGGETIDVRKISVLDWTLGFGWERKKAIIKDFFRTLNGKRYVVELNPTNSRYLVSTVKGYSRSDTENMISNLEKILESYDEIFMIPQREKRTFREIIEMISKIKLWVRQLSGRDIHFWQKTVYIISLIKAYDLFVQLDNYDLTRYEIVFLIFDVSRAESILTQYCKNRNIRTATLQHGVYTERRKIRNRFFNGMQLGASASDYMMTWNQMTIDAAKKMSLNENKFKLVGNLAYYNENKLEDDKKEDVIGVVLGRISLGENSKLVEAAIKIANDKNLSFVLRHHPGEIDYDAIYVARQSKYFSEELAYTQMSMIEYCKKVKISVIGGSSAFPMLLHYHQEVYRYSSGEDDDIFKGISYRSFRTEDELKELIESGTVCEEKDKGSMEYIVGPLNIEERYKDFLVSLKQKS